MSAGKIIVATMSFFLVASAGSGADLPVVTMHLDGGPDSASVGDRIPVRFTVIHSDSLEFLPLEGRRDLGDVYLLGDGRKGFSTVTGGMASETLFAAVVPFRTGRVTVPPIQLFYETGGGMKGEVYSDSVFLEVRSILPEGAVDIKPLKSNVPAPSDVMSYVVLSAVLAFLAVSLFLLARYLRRRKKPELPVPETPPRPAHEIAMEELGRIERLGLLSQGRFKEYYSLVSEAVRRYFGNRYGFDTMDLTTTELMVELRERGAEAASEQLWRFLGQSDLVKFAKYVPPYGEMEAFIGIAREIVKKNADSRTDTSDEEVLATGGGI